MDAVSTFKGLWAGADQSNNSGKQEIEANGIGKPLSNGSRYAEITDRR